MFIRRNANPENKNVNDCIVRAISIVENIPWDDVFSALCEIAVEEKAMPNYEGVYEKCLANLCYVKAFVEDEYGGLQPMLYKFAMDHPDIKAVLSVEGHAVPLINGDYYDIYDCGRQKVSLYYVKE